MADLPRRSIVAAEFITPDHDGQIRVLLTCDCSRVIDLTAEIPVAGSQEVAFTCEGCGTAHWFTVEALTTEQAKRAAWRRSLRGGTGDGND